MSQGGLYDVVGGGFHRYSVDDHWLVPHFEKMLYDNGQLALAYLHGHLLTGSEAFRQVCTETLDFIAREMMHPQGGFYSSLDADSEGEEGRYYVWTPQELAEAAGAPEDMALLEQVYAIRPGGNFEGNTILQRQGAREELAQATGLDESSLRSRLGEIHQRLYAYRERRVRPATDDKVLVMWNALALRAFAQAARYLRRDDYLVIARQNAGFLLDALYGEGRLMRAWRDGQARHNAYLEDHAALALALLDLYQSDPDPRWYQAARRLGEDILAHFADPRGGFFDTRDDHDPLITRPKELQDNATPSGNALAALALLWLAAYDERGALQSAAEAMLASVQDLLARHPTAFGLWLQAADFALGPVRQIAVVGPPDHPLRQELLAEIWRAYRPRTVVAAAPAPLDEPALLAQREMQAGLPTAYVCEGFVCRLPVSTVEDLRRQLDPPGAAR